MFHILKIFEISFVHLTSLCHHYFMFLSQKSAFEKHSYYDVGVPRFSGGNYPNLIGKSRKIEFCRFTLCNCTSKGQIVYGNSLWNYLKHDLPKSAGRNLYQGVHRGSKIGKNGLSKFNKHIIKDFNSSLHS